MSDIISGFKPFFNANSEVLVLGSFPSVKSRAVQFYYGNPRNRFWGMLCSFFGEPPVDTVEEKKAFLLRHGIALWDIVQSCSIQGSSDAKIRAYSVSDLSVVLRSAPIRAILLNGKKSYDIFCGRYGEIRVPYRFMPSTSPANVRYDECAWHAALKEIFLPDFRAE